MKVRIMKLKSRNYFIIIINVVIYYYYYSMAETGSHWGIYMFIYFYFNLL